jgi:hypothetical protein
MKCFVVLVMAALLSGCGSLKGQFENRAVCTVAKDQALTVSMYGPIGIASKLAEQDAAVLCGQVAVKKEGV